MAPITPAEVVWAVVTLLPAQVPMLVATWRPACSTTRTDRARATRAATPALTMSWVVAVAKSVAIALEMRAMEALAITLIAASARVEADENR